MWRASLASVKQWHERRRLKKSFKPMPRIASSRLSWGMTTDDATLQSWRDLHNPGLYEVKRGVPIFRAHRRKTRDALGKEIEIVVTDDDLPAIARNMSALQVEEGVPARIVDGHIKPGAEVPEAEQPALLGFALNPRCGRFGPKRTPCVMVDTYLKRDKLAIARERPFRSAEYYPDSKTIRGVALLLRDPQLDMGIVTYVGDEQPYLYAMENIMPDSIHDQPDRTDGEFTPQEVEHFEKLCRYMAKKGLLKYGEPGPSAPAANNTALPGNEPTKKKEEMLAHIRTEQPELYAKLEAAEKRIAGLIQEQERAKCAAIVERLKVDYKLDEETEIANLLAHTPAERERHIAYIKATHAPQDEQIQVYSGPSEGGLGNLSADHTAAASSLPNVGGYLDQGTSTTPFLKLALGYIADLVNQDTLGVVDSDPEKFFMVINPRTARLLAASPELHEYIKGSYWAEEEIKKGAHPNGKYGLPSSVYGFSVIVENAVRVTSHKGASRASSYAMPNQTILLASRPGDLEGVYGAPSFSTLTMFWFNDEMTVETKHDQWDRLTYGRVVEDTFESVTCPASGFLITSATEPIGEFARGLRNEDEDSDFIPQSAFRNPHLHPSEFSKGDKQMSDYKEQTQRVTGGGVGDPMLGVRNDSAGDLSAANGAYAIEQFDSGGSVRMTAEGGKATYSATSQFACDSSGTDIAFLPGNASTTVKVLQCIVSSTATAAATGDVTLIRRSAANTAGTSANASVGKLDTRDAANSSTPKHYTAHPTGLGAAVVTLRAERFSQQAAGTPPASRIVFDFQAQFGAKGLRLSGATDILALNVAAALGGAGNAWDVTWIWTEEPATA